MRIDKLIQKKSLPSFCTSNFEVLNSIMYFCHINKLPCLIECTSNQVNQFGGYTKITPKKFIKKISNIRKKIKFKKNKLFLGGDHLGPLPWKNLKTKIALKNSIKLIDSYLKQDFCKIHIDTSIKCKDEEKINSNIIFDRTLKILKNDKIKKGIKNRFIVIGTEVPLSGSGDNKRIIKTSNKQIEDEVLKFKKILKQIKSQSKIFALVIEPGMKYMHSKITSPDFKNFLDKKKFSKKNNFVFEAHSTDYQPLRILKKLTKNNFKFLKVGPELTYNYSRSLFFMQNLEEKFSFKKKSDMKNIILTTMKKNKKYWKAYYLGGRSNLLLNSKLDRMRYYLNLKPIVNSINILKENVNNIEKKKIIKLLGSNFEKDFLKLSKTNLTNFDILKLIFISQSLKKYFLACGFSIR